MYLPTPKRFAYDPISHEGKYRDLVFFGNIYYDTIPLKIVE